MPRHSDALDAATGRTVRFLIAAAGIDQLLDIGSGLPNVGNVRKVAQAISPAARVVHVDRATTNAAAGG